MPGRAQHSVFAYGSNLHLQDLASWMVIRGLGEPGISGVAVAELPAHRLAWNHRSAARGAGAANVEPEPGSSVWGALLEVDARTLAAIDLKEGHPHRYNRGDRPSAVLTAAGAALAWVYRVTPAYRRPGPVPPTAEYLSIVLDGARQLGLPDAWLDHLSWVQTLDSC